jgi:hypothetical protein
MKIYKDFNDWWANGNHGWSSASIDYAKEIWADLEPTINASRDDYENLMLTEIKQMHDRYIENLRDSYAYIKEHNVEEKTGVKFFKWLLDRKMGRI